MGKSNAEKRRTHKFAQTSPATRNFVQHALWQHHRLLERLINDPSAPNHLDRVADGDPVLREALWKAGVAGLTREQLYKLMNDGWLDAHVHVQMPSGQRLLDVEGLQKTLQGLCQWRVDSVFLRR